MHKQKSYELNRKQRDFEERMSDYEKIFGGPTGHGNGI